MLNVKKLSVVYGEKTVLKDVTLSFIPGQVTVISGFSGSGKTSFLNMVGLIQGVNKDCSIEYNGIDLLQLSPNKKQQFIKNNIGYVFQKNNLISTLSVYENVALQLRTVCKDDAKISASVSKWLTYVGIFDLKDKFPSDISGGEEQRVAIARALAMDQSIILADEPTSALDGAIRDNFFEILRKVTHEQGKIVLVASHDEHVFDYADTHYEIRDLNMEMVKKTSTQTHEPSALVHEKTNAPLFFRPLVHFNRVQRKKAVPNGFILFIGLIVAIGILGISVLFVFSERQALLTKSVSDSSIFIVNNSLPHKVTQDMEDFQSFSDDLINNIKAIDGVVAVKPYFEFPANGFTQNLDKDEENATFTIAVDGNVKQIKEKYTIQPFYDNDLKNHHFTKKLNDLNDEDLIVSETFLNSNEIDASSVLGKSVVFDTFIPVKQYINYIEISENNRLKRYDSDGNIYVKKSMKRRVGAILKHSFPYNRSMYGNAFFMNDKTMNALIATNRVVPERPRKSEEFEEKELRYSAYHISVSDLGKLDATTLKIKELSHNIETASLSQDIKQIEETVEFVSVVVMIVLGTITILTIGMLFFMFFFTNNARKKQAGIMKALGLSRTLILGIYSYELILYALKIALSATIFSGIASVIFIGSLIGISMVSLIGITFAYSLILSFTCVGIAGVIPIYKALKYEPIDIIRLN